MNRFTAELLVLVAITVAGIPAFAGLHSAWWSILVGGVLGIVVTRLSHARSRNARTSTVRDLAMVNFPPRDLPPAPSPFEGRDKELADGMKWLGTQAPSGPRIVWIFGEVGVGKTTLALKMAHRVAAHFPDGQLFVDLGAMRGDDGADPKGFSERIIRYFLLALLGPADDPSLTSAEARKRFRVLTRERRVLFVLDEFDEFVAVDRIADLLPTGPGCGVILTTRTRPPLGDGWLPIEVGPLGLADSVKLLRVVAGDRVAAQRHHAETLAEATEGHPLCVRVAATGLAALPYAPLETALRRLYEVRHGRETRAGVPLDLGFALLTEREREALRALALLPSDTFSPWQLAALVGAEEGAATELADRLALAGFVERNTRDSAGVAIYAVSHPIREYARARLLESTDATKQQEMTNRLATRRADRHAPLDDSLPERVIRAMFTGRLRTATHEARDAVAIARERADPKSEGIALAVLAEVRAELGNFEAARDLAHAALDSRVVSELSRARAHRCLGWLHRRLRQNDEARGQLTIAIEHAAASPADRAVAMRELALVRVMHDRSEAAGAMALLEEAIALSERYPGLGEKLRAGMFWASSLIQETLGQYKESAAALAKGLAAAERSDQLLMRAWLLHRKARLALAVEDYRGAEQTGFDAVEAFASMNHRYGKAHCRLAIGEALLLQEDREKAGQVLEEALENFINCADRWAEAETQRVLGLARLPAGGDQPRSLLAAARRIFADLGDTERVNLVREQQRRTEEVAV